MWDINISFVSFFLVNKNWDVHICLTIALDQKRIFVKKLFLKSQKLNNNIEFCIMHFF